MNQNVKVEPKEDDHYVVARVNLNTGRWQKLRVFHILDEASTYFDELMAELQAAPEPGVFVKIHGPWPDLVVEENRCGQSGTPFEVGQPVEWRDAHGGVWPAVVGVINDGMVMTSTEKNGNRTFNLFNGIWECGCMTLHPRTIAPPIDTEDPAAGLLAASGINVKGVE